MANTILTDFSDQNLTSAWQQEIHAYWKQLRGQKLMPARKDFDPLQVPSALGKIMIIEVGEGAEKYKFRLVGTEISTASGFDMNRHKFMELPGIEKVIKRFDRLLENKQPYYVRDVFHWSQDERIVYDSLVLPFSDNNTDVNMIFNCLDLIELPPEF